MPNLPEVPQVADFLKDFPAEAPPDVKEGALRNFYSTQIFPALVTRGDADPSQKDAGERAFINKYMGAPSSSPRTKLVATAAAAALVRPIASGMTSGGQDKKLLPNLNAIEERAANEAKRAGVWPWPYQTAGNIAGSAPWFAAAEAAMPAGGGLLGTMGRAGASVGAYEAAAAPQGETLERGLAGAAGGAAFGAAGHGIGALYRGLRGAAPAAEEAAAAAAAAKAKAPAQLEAPPERGVVPIPPETGWTYRGAEPGGRPPVEMQGGPPQLPAAPTLEMEKVNGLPTEGVGPGSDRAIETYAPRAPTLPVSQGAETAIRAEGADLPARYEVRDLADVIPTHHPVTGEVIPEHSLGGDVPDMAAVSERHLAMDPASMMKNPPIVNESGEVMGSQENALAVARAYVGGDLPQTGEYYKRMLVSHAPEFGADAEAVAQMERPVLVRVVPDSAIEAIPDDPLSGAGAKPAAAINPITAQILAENPTLFEPKPRPGAKPVAKRGTRLATIDEAIPEAAPAPAEGYTRIYRGDTTAGKANLPEWLQASMRERGVTEAQGRWFAPDVLKAQWYQSDALKGKLSYVDVPTSELESMRVKNNPTAARFSADPENEFFIPREYADQAQPVSGSIPMRDRPTGRAAVTGGEPIPGAPAEAAARITPTGPGKSETVFRSIDRETVAEESFHRAVIEQGIDNAEQLLHEVDPVKAQQMRAALPETYAGSRHGNEEVAAKLFAAVRTGNAETLQKFVDADGTKEEVLEFARKQAETIQGELAKRADSPQRKIAERRLQSVIRRTDQAYNELLDETSINGNELKMERGKFYYRSANEKGFHVFDDRATLLDHMDEANHFPDAPEAIGAQGTLPGTPGFPPTGGPDNARYATYNQPPPQAHPETASDFSKEFEAQKAEAGTGFDYLLKKPIRAGFRAASKLLRPTLDWAASFDKDLPGIYRLFYEASEASHDAQKATWELGVKVPREILKGIKPKRFEDMGRYAAAREAAANGKASAAELADVAANLHINDQEKAAVAKLSAHYKEMGSFFGIPLDRFIAEYLPRMRADDFDPSSIITDTGAPPVVRFFAHLARTGELDFRDYNVANLAYNYARLGSRWKFLKDPIKNLNDFSNQTIKQTETFGQTERSRIVDALGTAKPLIDRHIQFLLGRPDLSQRIIDETIANGFQIINEGLGKVREKVPRWVGSQLGDIAVPKDGMRKFMTATTAGTQGGRIMTPIRDGLQVIFGLPFLGTKYFAKGIAKAVDPATWKLAEEFAVLGNKSDFLNAVADIGGAQGASSKLERLAEASLIPQQKTHNIARLAIFRGHWDKLTDSVPEFLANQNYERFYRESGLQWGDAPFRKMMADRILQAPTQAARRQVIGEASRRMMEWSQFSLTKGDNPGFSQFGILRLFGQYGTWPANYVAYLKRFTQAEVNGLDRTKALALAGLSQLAILKAGEAAGIDTGNWVFSQPAGYRGGPAWQFASNAPAALFDWNSKEGDQARKKAMEPATLMMPGALAIKGFYHALAGDDPNPWARAAGFSSMTKQKEAQPVHKIFNVED